MGISIDPLSIVAIVIVLGIAAWGIRMLKNRLDEQRYMEEMAELEFTETLMSESAMSESVINDVYRDSAFKLQNIDSESGSLHLNQVSGLHISIKPEPVKADQASSGIINQLTQAGMYGSIDGYVELHGNVKGAAIIKLRNGKLALLVPHMESEAFIKRQSRRVDYIIMTMSDGKGIVVTPLEQLISENIMPG